MVCLEVMAPTPTPAEIDGDRQRSVKLSRLALGRMQRPPWHLAPQEGERGSGTPPTGCLYRGWGAARGFAVYTYLTSYY